MNPVNLKAQARAKGARKGKVFVMPPITTTQAQAKTLGRIYMMIVRAWQKAIERYILPEYANSLQQLRNDALTTDRTVDVEAALAEAENSVVQVILRFSNLFTGWANFLVHWHLNKFVSQIKYSTNVDLTSQLTTGEANETIEQFLARNVALVKSVSDQERSRIADIVFRGLQNRTPVTEVAKEIRIATGLARDRSLRIASDQTVKLSAKLDEERQQQVGMTSFKWRHSGKLHYRPWHKERDGKVFKWTSKVAKTDPPGYAPFCGCKAQGVLEID